ncbi:ABC transporter substrate-binding protein [Streptomyces sp. NPDC057654]|uniref:ABC transporter substrate-binding protein n=1 Tax=Streptomyces sp. NPDC057654 TaxID=3346196 RepID=UPI0036C16C0D
MKAARIEFQVYFELAAEVSGKVDVLLLSGVRECIDQADGGGEDFGFRDEFEGDDCVSASSDSSNWFPNVAGDSNFIREFRAAVAPSERGRLQHTPPLILLGVPGEGRTYTERVRRVVGALEGGLHKDGKLVPYASVELEFDRQEPPPLLAEKAGSKMARGVPRNMTPNNFSDFELLRDFVKRLRNPLEGEDNPNEARLLRDHVYSERVGRGGLLKALWVLGGRQAPTVPGGLPGWLLESVLQPLLRTLPRWLWVRRKTRRLLRGWLGEELDRRGSREGLFEVLSDVASVQRVHLSLPVGDSQHQDALEFLERILVRALLADLSRPAVGRLLPKRRRRTARPALLVALPMPGTEGSRVAERFLRSFSSTRSDSRALGPLVIGVGRLSPEFLAELNAQERNLTETGLLSHQPDGATVSTLLPEQSFTPGKEPVQCVAPKRYRIDWRVQTVLMTVLAVLCTMLLVIAARPLIGLSMPSPCADGNEPIAGPGAATPPTVRRQEWAAALQAIARENKRAEAFPAERAVRTVVHIGASEPTSESDAQFDSSIPELRGIALYQKRLNDAAVTNQKLIPLIVEERHVGDFFENAESEAEALVKEIGEQPQGEGRKKIVGVIGLAQSREETKKALQVLEKAHIPVVGTTATADEMGSAFDGTYWPLTPKNSTEARIAAKFAHEFRIVPRGGGAGGCTTADHAIVVEREVDLYSRSLAKRFQTQFESLASRASRFTINFDQSGIVSDPDANADLDSASSLADSVCDLLKAHPRSIVYWATRARDFSAFLDAMDERSTCTRNGLTVLGGNDLTNMATNGAFNGKQWLRLYYSSHSLPKDDPRATDETKDYARDYDAFVQRVDPWRQDGRSAVAYDALHALAKAAEIARGSDNLTTAGIRSAFRSVEFEGATGYIKFQNSGDPPYQKTLVILRASAKGPRTVLACGAYAKGETYAKQDRACAS